MNSACNFSHCQLPSPNVGLLCRDLCVEVRRLICPCGSGLQIGVAHPRRCSGPIIFSFSGPSLSGQHYGLWTYLQIAAYYPHYSVVFGYFAGALYVEVRMLICRVVRVQSLTRGKKVQSRREREIWISFLHFQEEKEKVIFLSQGSRGEREIKKIFSTFEKRKRNGFSFLKVREENEKF